MSLYDGASKFSKNDRDKVADMTKTGFDRETIEQLRQLGTIMVANVIHDLFYKTILYAGITHNETKEKIFYDFLVNTCEHRGCGSIAISTGHTGTDRGEVRLILQFAMVPADYEFDVEVPKNAVKTVQLKIKTLMDFAAAYYASFCQQNKVFIETLNEYLAPVNINFKEMHVDKKQNTLFFDKSIKTRIGLIAYYVDSNGKPFSTENLSAVANVDVANSNVTNAIAAVEDPIVASVDTTSEQPAAIKGSSTAALSKPEENTK